MLVHSGYGNGLLVRSDPSSSGPGRISDGFGVLRLGRKRVRLRRKNPVHEVFRAPFGDHSRPRVWKRLKLGVSLGKMMMLGGGSCMIILILGVLFMTGRVLAECHGVREPTPSGLHGLISGQFCMRTRAVDIHTRHEVSGTTTTTTTTTHTPTHTTTTRTHNKTTAPHHAKHCTHAWHLHLTHHTPRHKPHTTHDTTTRTHTHEHAPSTHTHNHTTSPDAELSY